MKSERMVLRRFIRADIERLFVFHNDPEVMRFLNGGKPTSRREVEYALARGAWEQRGVEDLLWTSVGRGTRSSAG